MRLKWGHVDYFSMHGNCGISRERKLLLFNMIWSKNVQGRSSERIYSYCSLIRNDHATSAILFFYFSRGFIENDGQRDISSLEFSLSLSLSHAENTTEEKSKKSRALTFFADKSRSVLGPRKKNRRERERKKKKMRCAYKNALASQCHYEGQKKRRENTSEGLRERERKVMSCFRCDLHFLLVRIQFVRSDSLENFGEASFSYAS